MVGYICWPQYEVFMGYLDLFKGYVKIMSRHKGYVRLCKDYVGYVGLRRVQVRSMLSYVGLCRLK
jgi:hypothetical protein